MRGFARASVADGILGQVINIGSGFEASIGDTAHAIAELMGMTIEVEVDEQRVRPQSSEVERLFAGIEKARERLGWVPAYEDGRFSPRSRRDDRLVYRQVQSRGICR